MPTVAGDFGRLFDRRHQAGKVEASLALVTAHQVGIASFSPALVTTRANVFGLAPPTPTRLPAVGVQPWTLGGGGSWFSRVG